MAERATWTYTPEIGLVFEHFTLEVGARPCRALEEHCVGWTRRCESPRSVHQGRLALGRTDALLWWGQPCSFRAVDHQQHLGLCHFVCLSEARTLSGRNSSVALENRETGSLFKALKEFFFFPPLHVRLPRGGLGSRCRFISLVSSRLNARSGSYQLK